MSRKQKTEPTTAETVAEIRDELETAEAKLAAIDPHKGSVDHVLELRRPLQDRISILRERLALAEQRQDEAEFAEAERRIDELEEQARQLASEIERERQKAAEQLRGFLNNDWLLGQGRFSSQPAAMDGLLGFSVGVIDAEQKRDAVLYEIRRLENRIRERRAARDREAAAARVEGRKNLIAGGTVEIPLTPWKIIPSPGFTSDIMDNLERRAIPSALPDPRQPEIHALLPPDSKPHNWADGFQIESAEPMPPAELCPAMAGVWSRATPSKKRAASR